MNQLQSKSLSAENQALIAQVAELTRANQNQSDFVSTVSHELRSPVANMRLATTMLELVFHRINSTLPPESQANLISAVRYLQILGAECDRSVELINNLLDLQRLEAGVELIVEKPIDLYHWVSKIVKPFREQASSREQTLLFHVQSDVPSIISSPSHLERIVAELLNNACKYTPRGGAIDGLVRFDSRKNNVRLRLCNPSVIPESDRTHIFEKFYRSPSVIGVASGTGLGLSLVRKLTERLGGRIWVESAEGQTCFTVELPICTKTHLKGV